ncbi:MAG: hypothetical protein IKH94_06615, partial [Eubacterium sp.]|nr:hypothetical protein [Eubacterium sp.]
MDYEIICGSTDIEVSGIANDSRKITEGMLYFAIPGANVDGAKFIPDVIRQDVSVIITEKAEKKLSDILQDDITVNGLFEELESERV